VDESRRTRQSAPPRRLSSSAVSRTKDRSPYSSSVDRTAPTFSRATRFSQITVSGSKQEGLLVPDAVKGLRLERRTTALGLVMGDLASQSVAALGEDLGLCGISGCGGKPPPPPPRLSRPPAALSSRSRRSACASGESASAALR